MNKPEVEIYSSSEIWHSVEYDTELSNGDFIKVEDHLAMLAYIKNLINGGSFNENT